MKSKFPNNKLLISILLTILISISANSRKVQTDISFVPSAAINITSDADFGPSGYNFAGDGSAGNPYIIENLEIDTTEQTAILVTGTTKHFIIRNCVVTAEGYGIFVDNVASGTAEIRENTCYGSIQGLMVWSTGSSIVANNTCTDNESYGIYVEFSPNSIIANNSCSGNSYGTLIIFSSGSEVANNVYINEGLDLYDNDFDNLQTYSVYNNLANGKPIGWFTNLQDIEMNISIYNQIYLINCTRCTIAGQNMQNSLKGITLYFCANTTLYKNTMNHLGFEGAGIVIINSENTTMEENNISYFEDGIRIFQNSKNTNITNNFCSNCANGISISSSESLIQYNRFKDGFVGIRAGYSSYISIYHNTIDHNDYYGIKFQSMDNSNITHNLIKNNDDYAIYLDDGSVNNKVHHNDFISNRQDPGSQAYDAGTNNVWYDAATNEGNGWDDLGTATTYLIDGTAGSVDLYPTNLAPIPEFHQIASLVLILSLFGVTFVTIMLRKRKNQI